MKKSYKIHTRIFKEWFNFHRTFLILCKKGEYYEEKNIASDHVPLEPYVKNPWPKAEINIDMYRVCYIKNIISAAVFKPGHCYVVSISWISVIRSQSDVWHSNNRKNDRDLKRREYQFCIFLKVSL